jgi:hypothetical protein
MMKSGKGRVRGFESLSLRSGIGNGRKSRENLHPKIWVHPSDASYDEFRIFQPESGYLGSVYTLNGANREVNSTYIVKGTLDKFSTPAGGFTWLEYEPNIFIDKDTYLEVIGGGIRVKKITYNDGLNSKEITNYNYDDPATFPGMIHLLSFFNEFQVLIFVELLAS